MSLSVLHLLWLSSLRRSLQASQPPSQEPGQSFGGSRGDRPSFARMFLSEGNVAIEQQLQPELAEYSRPCRVQRNLPAHPVMSAFVLAPQPTRQKLGRHRFL